MSRIILLRNSGDKMIDPIERDKLLSYWDQAKAQLEAAKTIEMEARKAVMAYCFPEAKEGTNRIPLENGFALKAVRKITCSLDKDFAKLNAAYAEIEKQGNEGAFLAGKILKRVYDFGAGEYKKLDANNPSHAAIKAIVDSVLTTKDGVPSLEIEPPKEPKK